MEEWRPLYECAVRNGAALGHVGISRPLVGKHALRCWFLSRTPAHESVLFTQLERYNPLE